MGTFSSSKQLAEDALRRVGSYAPHDTAADPDHLSIALRALDKNVKQLAGTIRAYWLVPATVSIPLAAGVNPVDAVNISAAVKDASFQFLVDAQISRAVDGVNGDQRDLHILTLREYNEIPDKASQGYPIFLYVDRLLSRPKFYFHPVPQDDSFTLHLSWQSYASDQTAETGIKESGLDQAWERWAEYQTAFDIGGGPVARRPTNELALWQRVADGAYHMLEAFHNRQYENEPPVTPYRDY